MEYTPQMAIKKYILICTMLIDQWVFGDTLFLDKLICPIFFHIVASYSLYPISNISIQCIFPLEVSMQISHWHSLLWLVVWIIFYFSIYWEFHHPNCYSVIFFRGVRLKPPTSLIDPLKLLKFPGWLIKCLLNIYPIIIVG